MPSETIIKIRRAYAHGFNAAEIGRVYGLKRSQVLRALGKAEAYRAAAAARQIEKLRMEVTRRGTLTTG